MCTKKRTLFESNRFLKDFPIEFHSGDVNKKIYLDFGYSPSSIILFLKPNPSVSLLLAAST